MTARPEMKAVETGGRLASDMYIEQWKKDPTCTGHASRTIYLGCVALSSRSVPVLVKVHAQLACIADVRPPGRPDSDLLRLDGCIEASFSQEESGFFFSPLLGENQGSCAAARHHPDASKRQRLHITHACLLQLRCALQGDSRGSRPRGRRRPLSPARPVV